MNISYQDKKYTYRCRIDNELMSIAHIHKEIEIAFVKSGKGAAFTGQQKYTLEPGDLFLTLPNQLHYYETIEKGEFYVLIFSPSYIHKIGGSLLTSTCRTNYIKNAAADEDIDFIFKKLICIEGKYKETETIGYVNVLFCKLARNLDIEFASKKDSLIPFDFMNYCSENYRNRITIDEVAKALGLSRSYLSKIINTTFKQNFNDYVNSYRISEACALLEKSDTKISAIAVGVGFDTIRSFNRAFVKKLGLTPSEYRFAIKNKQN